MKDDAYQTKLQEAVNLLRPIMRVLRIADRREPQHAIVWDEMAKLDAHYCDLIETHEGVIPEDQLKQIHQHVVDRWKYLHDPTHSAGYALNPHFHNIDCMLDESVKADLEAVVAEFYPNDMEQQVQCLMEFQQYKRKATNAWKNPIIWMQAKFLSPAGFWQTNGCHAPLLQPIALCVTQLNHAGGGCERNWSAHDFLYGKRRTSTSSNVLADEVYFYCNSRMHDAHIARGKLVKGKKRKHSSSLGADLLYPEWGDQYDSGSESD